MYSVCQLQMQSGLRLRTDGIRTTEEQWQENVA
jgi:hypothetical protein